MKLRNKKTGEIWCIGKILTNDHPCWENLSQICEDWEDIKEPLIKVDQIRKAVRAWAEANDFEDIEIHSLTAGTRFSVSHYYIDFIGYFIHEFEGDETYNIAELCGEDEQ